jgi:hypothetical protein
VWELKVPPIFILPLHALGIAGEQDGGDMLLLSRNLVIEKQVYDNLRTKKHVRTIITVAR